MKKLFCPILTVISLSFSLSLASSNRASCDARMSAAVVFGPTGAVGRQVVNELLVNPLYSKIIALVRKPLSEDQLAVLFDAANTTNRRKLEMRVVDYNALSREDVSASDGDQEESLRKVGYCCLGTTRHDAGSAEAFRQVDYTYVTRAGDMALAAGINEFAIVSASNADANSYFLYPKTKGEADDYLAKLGFSNLFIARPGLLNRGDDARTVEKIALWIIPSISVRDVARGLIAAVDEANQDVKLVHGEGSGHGVKVLWNADLIDKAKGPKI